MILKKVRNFFKRIGPGFITGAADDDPSGIATYSIAGAKYGYKLNWTMVFLWPAMMSIQEMCGRVGMVSGKGLATIIKKYYSKRMLVLATSLLAIANIINIGADLGIMAASMQMLFDFNYFYWLAIAAIFIVWMQIAVPYRKYVKYLQWQSMILVVYLITAFLVKHDFNNLVWDSFVPQVEINLEYLMVVIGLVGTTISPYLFFWQSAEEVEEEIAEGKLKDFNYHPKVVKKDIKKMEFDTKAGMLFSNLIALAIMLTTAGTLHANGIFSIDTPQQAAQALRPLAGNFAYILFAVGIIGIGWQSIPVLAGSLAYAISEAFGLKEGLSKKFSQAKVFYIIIAVATGIGFLINLLGINVMDALYYAAIINGVASVPLIAIIIKIADDERVVGKFKSKKKHKWAALITLFFMTIGVGIMLWQIVANKL
ncbi:MAG: divalent metal cation transporter [Candidatus Shapirobacteria bacterium]|nr:divalent metal cation transporter [Candidatus Shapirobacteria bacterium]MDD4410801.1 divalent metal cation transporter [Candidatus Shapirobacteria bacterium]